MTSRPLKPLVPAEPELFDDAPTMVRPVRGLRLEGLTEDPLLELELDDFEASQGV